MGLFFLLKGQALLRLEQHAHLLLVIFIHTKPLVDLLVLARSIHIEHRKIATHIEEAMSVLPDMKHKLPRVLPSVGFTRF